MPLSEDQPVRIRGGEGCGWPPASPFGKPWSEPIDMGPENEGERESYVFTYFAFRERLPLVVSYEHAILTELHFSTFKLGNYLAISLVPI